MEKYYFKKLNYVRYNFIHNKNYHSGISDSEIDDYSSIYDNEYIDACFYTTKSIEFITYERFKADPPFSKIFFNNFDSILDFFSNKYKINMDFEFRDFYIGIFLKEIYWDYILEVMSFDDFTEIVYGNLTIPLITIVEKPKNNQHSLIFNVDFFEELNRNGRKNVLLSRIPHLDGLFLQKGFIRSTLEEAQILGLYILGSHVGTLMDSVVEGQILKNVNIINVDSYNSENKFANILFDNYYKYTIHFTSEALDYIFSLNDSLYIGTEYTNLENNYEAIMNIFFENMLPFEVISPAYLD